MTFVGTLRPYQAEAVDRMVERGRMLVAMTQGSGKTPTTICAVERLNEEFDDTLCCVVLASSALRYQWRDSISQFTGGKVDEKGHWTGGADVVVIDGTQDKRIKLYERAMSDAPHYILLGYEQVISDYDWVRKIPMDILVMDEVSMLKSPAAQRSQAVKTLDATFKFGLTGTPIENGKPDELFSIMEAIDPTVLGDPEMYERTFVVRGPAGFVKGWRNLPTLHKTISNAMIRVQRDDPAVAEWMPKQVAPRTHLVTADSATANLYDLISCDLQADLQLAVQSASRFDLAALYSGSQVGGDEITGAIASKIAVMRMLLTSPSILRASAVKFEETAHAKRQQGSGYAFELLDQGLLDNLSDVGQKMRKVITRLDRILDSADENKIVVFSFFKGALQVLADEFPGEAVQFHGGMNASQKADAKRKFQYDPDVRLFLSSDAGGYGVDLPQANWLINVDLPFSKGKSDQRNSRHDRSSSLHSEIHTETFLVAGSIEEFYASRLDAKGGVARAIIDGKGYDRKGRLEMNANTLLNWLGENSV